MFSSVASWPAYRCLRRQVTWFGISISSRIFHSFVIHRVKGFSVVNEAEVNIFPEFSHFFYDPTDVGNLISGSSPFSKSSLNIWKFPVHVLLKPDLENFEHYFTSMWDKGNCAVVWTFFGIALLGVEVKTDFFQSCGHCWVFQICWYIKCSTLTALSFRIWSISAGIPSLPFCLFRVMLPKAHLTSNSRMSGSRWVITPPWLSASYTQILLMRLVWPQNPLELIATQNKILELIGAHHLLSSSVGWLLCPNVAAGVFRCLTWSSADLNSHSHTQTLKANAFWAKNKVDIKVCLNKSSLF